jgi:hypothetical protein
MKTRILVTIFLLITALAYATLAEKLQVQRNDTPEARVPGILNEGAQNSVEAPESVAVGEEFEVKITTSGGGCERIGDTSVLLTETSATVLVYDFTAATRPGVACTMIFKQMPHIAKLRFTKPGTATIRIWGRRMGVGAPPEGTPTVVERRVLVK